MNFDYKKYLDWFIKNVIDRPIEVVGLSRTRAARLIHSRKGVVSLELQDVKDIQDDNVCTGLKTEEVILRKKIFSLREKRKIRAVLPFQLEQILPYATDEAIVLPYYRKKGKKESEVTFFSTKISSLKKHLDQWHSVDPKWVSSIPAALGRFIEHYFWNVQNCVCIHVDFNKTSLVVVNKNEIISSLAIDQGMNDFILEEWTKEVERALDFLKKKERIRADTKLILCGEVFQNEFIVETIYECISSYSFIEIVDEENIHKLHLHAAEIGLAFDAAAQDSRSQQFRIDPFTSKREKKEIHKRFCYLVCCGCALLLLTFGIGKMLIGKKENHFQNIEEITGSKKFNKTALINQVLVLEQNMAEHKKKFRYFSSLPPVRQFLNWVAYHPLLNADQIEIKKIRYYLENYPKLGESTQKYRVKVEIEWLSPSKRNARNFHDLLKKGNGIVNGKEKITWECKESLYKTSFYLKKYDENVY